MSDSVPGRHTRLPAVKGPSPRTVEEARLEVQRSRARIEETLDRLESRVVETRETIQRKVDIVRPITEFVRAKPFIAIGAAVAIGLFLGTRGGDDDEEDEDYGFDRKERRALEEWRKRRRRMLLAEAEDAGEVFEDDEDEPPGRFSRMVRAVGHEAAGVMLGIVGAEVAERLYGTRSHDGDDDDVDVDDGDDGDDNDVDDDDVDDALDDERDTEYDDDDGA